MVLVRWQAGALKQRTGRNITRGGDQVKADQREWARETLAEGGTSRAGVTKLAQGKVDEWRAEERVRSRTLRKNEGSARAQEPRSEGQQRMMTTHMAKAKGVPMETPRDGGPKTATADKRIFHPEFLPKDQDP